MILSFQNKEKVVRNQLLFPGTELWHYAVYFKVHNKGDNYA